MVSHFYIRTHPFFVHPPTASGGLSLIYKHLFQFSSHVLWAGLVSLDKHSQRESYQAEVLVWSYCWWVQTQLGFTVLTTGAVGFTWIWAGYSAAGSNLQGLFFYCKWLSFLLQTTPFFLRRGGEGAVPVPLTLCQQQNLHPEPHLLLQWTQSDRSIGISLPAGISSPGFVQIAHLVVPPGAYLGYLSFPLGLLPYALKAQWKTIEMKSVMLLLSKLPL